MSYYNESTYLKLGKLWIRVKGKATIGWFRWNPIGSYLAPTAATVSNGFHQVSWLKW